MGALLQTVVRESRAAAGTRAIRLPGIPAMRDPPRIPQIALPERLSDRT